MLKTDNANLLIENKVSSLTNALICISVGQEYHEGERFAKDIEIANHKYDECTILCGDLLQRHTIQILKNVADDVAYRESLSNGSQWLERNRKTLDNLKIGYQIVCWNDILTMPEFAVSKKFVDELYHVGDKQSIDFYECVEQSVKSFIKRYEEKNLITRDNNARNCGLATQYILEECAAIHMLTDAKYNFTHIQYPYRSNKAICFIVNLVNKQNHQIIQHVITNNIIANPARTTFYKSPAVNVEEELKNAYLNLALSHLNIIWTDKVLPPQIKKAALQQILLNIKRMLAAPMESKSIAFNKG